MIALESSPYPLYDNIRLAVDQRIISDFIKEGPNANFTFKILP